LIHARYPWRFSPIHAMLCPPSSEITDMDVPWHSPDDPARLHTLVHGEASAKQRDRYRVVFLAGQGLGDGPLTREEVARTAGRSRQFVDKWVGRYRKNGLDALTPKKQPGAKAKLTEPQRQELCSMLDAGPKPEEGLAAYNGPVLRDKIEKHFGAVYSLAGIYVLLHRLGYNDLMPRTTHPDTDPEKLEAFKKKNSRRS
jgi:transposase